MKKTLFLLLSALIFSSGCIIEKPDPPPTTTEVVNALTEYALINKIYSDSFDVADDAAKDADEQIDGKKTTKDGYPIISISPLDATTWPKSITIDYGTENFLGIDGRYRRGIIQIETSDYYRNEGAILSITYSNYYQNNYKVEGTQIVTNNGLNDNNNLVYTVEVEAGHITSPEDLHIYFEQNTTREWTEGSETLLQPCDDVYLIEGTQTGTSSDNIDYTLTIQEPLDILICCKWVRTGLLDVAIEDLTSITIDYGYGTGGCDNQAAIIINDNSYPITME